MAKIQKVERKTKDNCKKSIEFLPDCFILCTFACKLIKNRNALTIFKKLFLSLALASVMGGGIVLAQADSIGMPTALTVSTSDSLLADTAGLPTVEQMIGEEDIDALQAMAQGDGLHEQLKTKFVEGSAGFMSLVALALVIGLVLCIERIIYLTLAEVNAKRLLADIEKHVEKDDLEGAKTVCRNTRGPVASICYQGLMHAHEDLATVERSIVSYGTVQSGNLEKGCSWIRLMIAIAPSLGFLGTVIGMVIAFDRMQEAGDISPKIVAEGMKVALITTIFGIIVALVLQLFYNYILNKIERLTAQMEEAAIDLLDILMKKKRTLKHDVLI